MSSGEHLVSNYIKNWKCWECCKWAKVDPFTPSSAERIDVFKCKIILLSNFFHNLTMCIKLKKIRKLTVRLAPYTYNLACYCYDKTYCQYVIKYSIIDLYRCKEKKASRGRKRCLVFVYGAACVCVCFVWCLCVCVCFYMCVCIWVYVCAPDTWAVCGPCGSAVSLVVSALVYHCRFLMAHTVGEWRHTS